jgi:hypothetical protein
MIASEIRTPRLFLAHTSSPELQILAGYGPGLLTIFIVYQIKASGTQFEERTVMAPPAWLGKKACHLPRGGHNDLGSDLH